MKIKVKTRIKVGKTGVKIQEMEMKFSILQIIQTKNFIFIQIAIEMRI